MTTKDTELISRAIAEIIVATGGLGGAILAAVKYLAPVLKRWYMNYQALKAVVEQLPRFMETSNQIAHVTHELSPNNGSSVKDAITRIEELVKISAVKHHATWKYTDACVFYTDENGLFTEVSHNLISFVRRDDSQLLGLGWLNLFPLDTRTTIDADWEHAVKLRRNFEIESIVNIEGRPILVRIHAEPMLHGSTLLGYAGRIVELKGN